MIFSSISVISIVVLAIITIAYMLAIFTKGRSKRIDFIRKFKKGNCAIVYLVAIPLYWMGHVFAGENIFPSLFSAINKTMVLVVLRYDLSSIKALMAANSIYTVAVYFCFILVAINAMLFALSFLHQKIWEWFQKKQWKWSRKEKLLIVGNNEENLSIYTSENNRAAMVVDDISEKERTKLYAKRVSFVSKSNEVYDIKNKDNVNSLRNGIEEYCCKLLSKTLSNKKRSCIIVVNTRDDKRNIAICHKIVEYTQEFFKDKDESSIADILTRVRIYVFGMPIHETVYSGIVELSNGCIRYVNKYRQIAMDFVGKYPLTQFMTSEQIDYKTSLLRKNVEINVAMIGFGKTNRQIFLTSVANNQFLIENNGEKILKKVRYHIFDKQYIENNKNLNHSYYRFKNEFKDEIKKMAEGEQNSLYLPFPAIPAEEYYDKLDVNDSEFYEKIKSSLSGSWAFNYIIIAFGTDLENVDMAQKMLEKKQEWGFENTFIFVKVRTGGVVHPIFKRDDCFIIGDEKRVVYNIQSIDDDSITNMAKKRNRIYSLEYELASKPNKIFVEPIEKIYAQADCDWYINKTQFERESNLYACLSLRSKLHMMGLDYVSAEEKDKVVPISKDTYLNCYADDDKPIYYDGVLADGKEVVKYDLDFKDSRRKTLAIHEHLRWNSFMLSKGFVPASKDEILKDKLKNGKNYFLRRHGNLTTFEGLIEFRKLIAQRDGVDEIVKDVIKYDYQLLDDAYWLLDSSNYILTSREK